LNVARNGFVQITFHVIFGHSLISIGNAQKNLIWTDSLNVALDLWENKLLTK